MNDEPDEWPSPADEGGTARQEPTAAPGPDGPYRGPGDPPTGPLWAAPPTPAAPRRSRARRVWIAVGATVAGLVLAGGGFGAGVAFAGSPTAGAHGAAGAHGTHAARSAHVKRPKRPRTPAPSTPAVPAVPGAPGVPAAPGAPGPTA